MHTVHLHHHLLYHLLHHLPLLQVDCHYLQLYLWRFVEDEAVVQQLLEEVLASALHRSLDLTLMEPSVVEVICDKGG